MTAVAASIATSSSRLSYAGVQFALAFYLIHLSDFSIQTNLAMGRDRILGVLLGTTMMWLVFERLFPNRLPMRWCAFSLLIFDSWRISSRIAHPPMIRSRSLEFVDSEKRFTVALGKSRHKPTPFRSRQVPCAQGAWPRAIAFAGGKPCCALSICCRPLCFSSASSPGTAPGLVPSPYLKTTSALSARESS